MCNVARSIATTKLWDTMSNPKSPHDVVHRQPLKRFAIELSSTTKSRVIANATWFTTLRLRPHATAPPLATPGPGPGPPVEPALRRAGAHTYTCKTYMCKRTAKHPKTFKN